jgi:uncharacterized protein (TIGR03067 family)
MSPASIGLLLGSLIPVFAEPPRPDLEQLQGWWRPTSLVYDGGHGVSAATLRRYVVRIQGVVLTEASERGSLRSRSTLRIHPNRNPREVDLTVEEDSGKGSLLLGIYRLDGDTLTICHALKGEPRPTGLTSKPGSKWLLETYEREHPSREVAEQRNRKIAELESQQRNERARARLATVKNARPCLTLAGHRSTVWDLAFSPDGKRLVSAGDVDEPVRLWDLDTGSTRADFRLGFSGHYPVRLAFAPDGKTVALGSLDPKQSEKPANERRWTVLRLWDPDAGTSRSLVVTRDYPSHVGSLAYSRDGKTLVVNNGRRLYLWDVAGQRVHAELRVPPDSRVSDFNTMVFLRAVLSPDGRTLATSGQDQRVRLWDAASGESLAIYRGHDQPVLSVAFAPDGKRLASGGDRTVRIWPVPEMPTGARLTIAAERTLRFNDLVTQVAFSPDGSLLAVAGHRGVVTLVDGRTWESRSSFDTGQEYCLTMAVSPDGTLLATGGVPSEIRIWELAPLLKAPR